MKHYSVRYGVSFYIPTLNFPIYMPSADKICTILVDALVMVTATSLKVIARLLPSNLLHSQGTTAEAGPSGAS
jgi:hypothetical protein